MITFLYATVTHNLFDFECQGCHTRHALAVPIQQLNVTCPARCGTRYQQWINTSRNNEPSLKCIHIPDELIS